MKAEAKVLWQIGERDGDYRELAIAGQSGQFLSRFPKDVLYRIGKSRPEQDWPYFHPGPDDLWQGRRRHPFRIEFNLAALPKVGCRLNLELLASNNTLLEIDVNDRRRCRFRLPANAPANVAVDPSVGHTFPLSVPLALRHFRRGRNHIVLTVVSGGWLLYDALWLEGGVAVPKQPELAKPEVHSTLFFKREGGRLKQAIHVSLQNDGGEGEAKVQLTGKRRQRQRLGLVPGLNTYHLLVPPFTRREGMRLAVEAGGKEQSVEFEGKPERRWKVFVAPSTHTDIGYTDLQEITFATHNKNTALALETCDKDPDFKWNLEVGFQAPLFRQHDPKAFPRLIERIREGRIGLQGLYLHMLTGLCSGEELIQTLARPQKLAREYGLSVESANLTDVPSAVGTMPMFLSQSGIRYFAEAINQWRGPLFRHADKRLVQAPFWWEGLDGSRVLALFSDVYAQSMRFGLVDTKETAEQKLAGWLQSYDRKDYRCDAVYVYGAFSDNVALNPRYSAVAREWKEEWAYPKIILSRVDEFFRYVEKSFGEEIPVFRGDPGVYWEDGAASSAYETALVRWAKEQLETAERWEALAAAQGSGPASPADRVHDAWEEVIFYDEHTWGAHCSISQPESEQTKGQWAFKAAYATRAVEKAEAVHRSPESAFAKHLSPKPAGSAQAIAIFNQHSWPRDLLVSVSAREEDSLVVREASNGRLLPMQQSNGKLLFVAEQVPALGYRSYLLEKGKAKPDPGLLRKGADEWTWETPDYRLRFDPETGALVRLVERCSRREWVDRASGYGLNQFVYVLGGEGTRMIQPANKEEPKYDIYTHTEARVRVVENGPLRAVLHVTCSGPEVSPTDTFVVLQKSGQLGFLNLIHKNETTAKEAGYFAFPFRLDQPKAARAFVELPYGIVQVEKEQIPGGCREWYATHSFAAVSDGRVTAHLATPHAPLLTVGEIFRGEWKGKLEKQNGTLFAYVFNNYWDTNYKASQGGDLLFGFSVRLRAGGFDPLEATQFGWEALANMPDPRLVKDPGLWSRGDAAAEATAAPARAEGCLLKVLRGKAVVGSLRWEEGELQVRLYNPGPKPTKAVFSLPSLRIKQAWQTNLVGVKQKKLRPAADATLEVVVPGRGLATVTIAAAGE